MDLRPIQGDEKSGPATTLHRSGAPTLCHLDRSGEISVLMLPLGNLGMFFDRSAATCYLLVLTQTL
jgi:hypothetical protein